jgi:hypothetical protein
MKGKSMILKWEVFCWKLKNNLDETRKVVLQKNDNLKENICFKKEQMIIHGFCDSFFREKINVTI